MKESRAALEESQAASKESQTALEAERKASAAAAAEFKKKTESREGFTRLRKRLWEMLAGPERQNAAITGKLINEVVREYKEKMQRLHELNASNQVRSQPAPTQPLAQHCCLTPSPAAEGIGLCQPVVNSCLGTLLSGNHGHTLFNQIAVVNFGCSL